MRCIICKLDKPGSREHVFPESIGGSYKIYTVCKDCNDKVGREVDSKLTDHLFVKMIRYELGLAGKKKIIPLPFRYGKLIRNTSDNEEIKVSLGHDGVSGGFQGRVINKPPKFKREDAGIDWYNCLVDGEDLEALVSMIQSFCRKKGVTEPPPQELADFVEYVRRVPDGHGFQIKIADDLLFRCELMKAKPNVVECSAVVDTVDYKRSIAKIAYELACEWLGVRYLEDPCGGKLLRFILDPSFVSPPVKNAVGTGLVSLDS